LVATAAAASRVVAGPVMDRDDELGPVLIAPSSYLELRNLIRQTLGFPNRRALLIGIDGGDGSGKSSLASWLSWQLEMPAIHLDIYFVRGSNPLAWRSDDLARAVDGAQLTSQRPVIVEGVLLLRALQTIGRMPDFLVFIEKDKHEPGMREDLEGYLNVERPREQASFVLKWSSADYDERIRVVHDCSRLGRASRLKCVANSRGLRRAWRSGQRAIRTEFVANLRGVSAARRAGEFWPRGPR
jgi:hypothetical protein